MGLWSLGLLTRICWTHSADLDISTLRKVVVARVGIVEVFQPKFTKSPPHARRAAPIHVARMHTRDEHPRIVYTRMEAQGSSRGQFEGHAGIEGVTSPRLPLLNLELSQSLLKLALASTVRSSVFHSSCVSARSCARGTGAQRTSPAEVPEPHWRLLGGRSCHSTPGAGSSWSCRSFVAI